MFGAALRLTATLSHTDPATSSVPHLLLSATLLTLLGICALGAYVAVVSSPTLRRRIYARIYASVSTSEDAPDKSGAAPPRATAAPRPRRTMQDRAPSPTPPPEVEPPQGSAASRREALMSMSVRELKKCMVEHGLSPDGLLEKSEFVEALLGVMKY